MDEITYVDRRQGRERREGERRKLKQCGGCKYWQRDDREYNPRKPELHGITGDCPMIEPTLWMKTPFDAWCPRYEVKEEAANGTP